MGRLQRIRPDDPCVYPYRPFWYFCGLTHAHNPYSTGNFIRTVTETRGDWLLEFAPEYFEIATFPEGETKRALQRIVMKKQGKLPSGSNAGDRDGRDKKKRKKER